MVAGLIVGFFFGGLFGLFIASLCRRAKLTELYSTIDTLARKLNTEKRRCLIYKGRWLRRTLR